MQASRALVSLVAGVTLVLALAVGAPAFASETIPAGVDLWATAAGHTHTSFANDPIPAGFFCQGGKAFTGRIAFRGEPLKTEPAGSLNGADTVVRRLDDATFNAKGEAVTRIQLLALSLASVKPIDTGCGLYDVQARLYGPQPTTDMRITRTATNGGSYVAPLALNVELVFTPVHGDPAARRILTRSVTLGPSSMAVWTYATEPRYKGKVAIDTDGDGKPDTILPAASRFVAGVSPSPSGQPVTVTSCTMGTNSTSCPAGQCLHQACHCNPNSGTWDPYDPGAGCTYLHCLWVCVPVGSGPSGGSGTIGTGTTGTGSVGTATATPVCDEIASP